MYRLLRDMHNSYAFTTGIMTLVIANFILNVLEFEHQIDTQVRAREGCLLVSAHTGGCRRGGRADVVGGSMKEREESVSFDLI